MSFSAEEWKWAQTESPEDGHLQTAYPGPSTNRWTDESLAAIERHHR